MNNIDLITDMPKSMILEHFILDFKGIEIYKPKLFASLSNHTQLRINLNSICCRNDKNDFASFSVYHSIDGSNVHFYSGRIQNYDIYKATLDTIIKFATRKID